MSPTERNTMLVRRAVDEVWNRGNFSVVEELAAEDIVVHMTTTGEDLHGPAGIKQFYSLLHGAFPDIHFAIDDQIAAGDRVVTRWTARGTHKGTFQGIAPTGKTIHLTGIDIDRFVNGKVVECWPQSDELGLLVQLGAIPAAG